MRRSSSWGRAAPERSSSPTPSTRPARAANNPFVAINCSAFPPHLLSSELFGYEEGAFTGAAKGGKLGLFELAHGGTLFLDEIGDMEFDLQAKLLRILETGEFMRIGGTKPIKVDVRIVSATNKDLEKLIRETKYREDLFYRLNVIAIRIPPLRTRPGDIPVLVEYCLDRLGAKMKRKFTASEEALAILSQYHYPGNVRELFNILEFAANTCETQTIHAERSADLLESQVPAGAPGGPLRHAQDIGERGHHGGPEEFRHVRGRQAKGRPAPRHLAGDALQQDPAVRRSERVSRWPGARFARTCIMRAKRRIHGFMD